MTKYKLFITGGHLTPAIATIDALEERGNFDVVFIGRKFAKEGDEELSVEYQLISARGIRFLPLSAGRIQRKFTKYTIPALLKIPVGFVQAGIYCLRERPSVIVSFGGYIAFPVALAAFCLGIPVITHEQTLAPGLTNKLIANLAKRVCVAFEETKSFFPTGKAVYTGLPIRKQLFAKLSAAPYDVNLKSYPLLYITGGATGAQSLNQLLYPIIPKLLDECTIIHQVGNTIADAQSVRATLSREKQSRYIPESYIGADRLSWIFRHATIVVGRSGANTVIELATFARVALLVPLPWSANGEQEKNALWLAEHGGAMVLDQKDLESDRLYFEIEKLLGNHSSMKKKAEIFAPHIPQDGADKLVTHIESLL